ncbi:DUF4288 domain-containing protein [Yinghuangia soli]|uniref:DUF4288 domain-containing protein n=1 Tax=Yinghuangia soli TaxID=2908204 RepID=A0AA41U5R9_9ACTN|nr:DUF4288 domain-containing protein [Yinghuangia soli]MCF2530249.1 DUF4288 domain-containing protein [Yinghuangia soli]
MATYVAVLLAESRVSGADGAIGAEPLYQESFVLLRADGAEDAREKAGAHGRGQQTAYVNAEGNTVSWTHKAVVDVSEVLDADLGDGAELYARHFRNYQAYQAFEPLLSGEDI